MWTKQQRFSISVICVGPAVQRVEHQNKRSAGLQPERTSTTSDWKDRKWCDNSCGPLQLQTHLKYSHADKPQMHTGGTGNGYWSLQITRVTPVSAKAETSGSFQETELALILNTFMWKPGSKLPFIIKTLQPCLHACGSFSKDVTPVCWTLEMRLWTTPSA